MKQMTLIEMDGFLKGECIPGDLKVNETNAEYLVRKFGGLESKLETALRECRSAGITIDNLEAKCAALAAENAGMSARTPVAYSYRYAGCETCDGFQDWRWELSKEKPPEWMLETGKVTNLIELFELQETPATDAFLAEVRTHDLNAFIRHHSAELDAHIKNGGEQFDEKSVRIRDIIVSARLFREQIRKEAAQ